MSDLKDILKPALSQLALALVPHLAEELLTAVTAHFQNTAPTQPTTDKKTVQQLAEEDAAREDATSAQTDKAPEKTGNRRKRGAGATSDANAEAGEQKEPEQTEQSADTGATGGRKRRTKASEQTKEPVKLIADNTEQAALRAQLIVDLGDLADVEEAHPRVAKALSDAGAATIDQVPSAALGSLALAVEALIEEYYSDDEE